MPLSNDVSFELQNRLTNSKVMDANAVDEDACAIVDESEVGEFFKAVREMDLEANSWRSQGDFKAFVSRKE